MIRHNGPISGVACSPQFVATAGYDNQVILWNAANKTALARGCHDHLANRCEISRDEKLLVSASSDYTARVWELPSMKLKAVLGNHSDDVEMARFSPDGGRIGTVSQDGKVRVFSVNGELLIAFSGHQGCAQALAWSADGRKIVSSGDDGTIRTWNLISGEQESLFRPEKVQTDSVVMSSAGLVYAGNDAGEVMRIDGERLLKIKVHRSGIKNLILNQEETRLVSVSYDRDLTLIDTCGMKIIKKIGIPPVVWARGCTFQDGDNLIFGTFGSSYCRLNLVTEEWDFSKVEATDCINAVLVDEELVFAVGDSGQVRSANRGQAGTTVSARDVVAEMGSLCNFITRFNNRIVCGGHLGKVFDALTGEELISLKCPINKAIQAGEFLVLATYVGELAIFKERGGALEMVGEFPVLQNAVKDLSVCGNIVFCGGAAADIALFDLHTLRVTSLRTGAHDNIVNSCVALGGGKFATVSRDLRLKIWCGVEEEENLATPFDHSIKCTSTSADRRYIAAAAYDGTMALYDRETRSWPVFRRLTAAGVSSLTFADGAFWASSYDGNIYRVNVP